MPPQNKRPWPSVNGGNELATLKRVASTPKSHGSQSFPMLAWILHSCAGGRGHSWRGAGFQTCRIADFQIGRASKRCGVGEFGNSRYSRLGRLRYSVAIPGLRITGVALALTLSAADAQVAASVSASDLGPSTNSELRTPSSDSPWLNPAQLPQLTWGPFDLHPHLRELVLADDNIAFTAKNQQEDIANDLAGGFRIVGGDRSTLRDYAKRDYPVDAAALSTSYLIIHPPETWPDKFLVLDYLTQWQAYTRYTGNNSVDQFVAATAEWPMAKLVLGLAENYSDQKTLLISGATRTEVQQNQTEVNAGYRLNEKLSLNTAVDFQDVAYPEAPTLSGYTEGKWTLSANREVAHLFNASVVLAGGLDNVEVGSDQQFVDFGGRIRYEYSELFTVDVSAGGEYRQYDSGIAATLEPYGTLAGTYSPSERTSFTLKFGRQQFPSLYNGYYYTSTGGELIFRKYFTDRFSLQSDLAYYESEYSPTSKGTVNNRNSSDYYAVKIAGKVRLLKYLEAELFYLFRGSGISQNYDSLQENQVGLQLEARY